MKMLESQEANIAVSFRNIHSIITRGLSVSIENVPGVLQHGFQGEGKWDGLFNYIRALSSVLNSHHLTEDEITFPYFRDKIPEAPEHGVKHAVPPYLTVPFLLYNLSPEDRLVFSEGIPAEVLQNLVPIVWKAKWESMIPYLLA
jgi:hypothetical protein